jgi:hypothetical protein
MQWLIELEGNEIDKSIWKALAKPPFDPHIITHNISGRTIHGLRSEEVDNAQSAREAMEIAETVCDRIYGAVSLEYATEPLTPTRVYSINLDGSLGAHMLIDPAVIKIRGGWIEMGSGNAQDDMSASLLSPSNLQRWNAALTNGDEVRDLIMFVGRSNNWFDIYKALEISINLSGSENDLVAFLKKKNGPDLKKLKRTANHFRHATKVNSLPPTAPSLVQAREQLARIVVLLLEDKVPRS